VIHLKNISTVVALVLCFSAIAYSQNQSAEAERLRIQAEERVRKQVEEKDWEAKIFELKYANPNTLTNTLGVFHAEVASPGGRLLTVRAPKEIMPAIEDTIKRFDVASAGFKDAELTIYVLLANDQAGPGRPMPQVLQPVLTQLRNVLAYKGYQLVDTLIARGNTNNGNISLMGTLPIAVGTSEVSAHYDFQTFFQLENPADKDPVLRLGRMVFSLSVPDVNNRVENLRIGTEVNIPRNQQVVVGKATYKDQAFILVMSSKFD